MTLGREKLRGCLYRFRDSNQEEIDALSPNCLSCFLNETSLQNTKLGCYHCVFSLKPESHERKDL